MLQSRTKNSSVQIPLKSHDIHVDVKDTIACFTLKQVFANNEEFPIEAIYTFPTQYGASVFSFEATTQNGTVIKAVIKEKNEAKREYNRAISEGNTAYYMDRTEKGSIFSMVVGNLAPKETIEICIKLVSMLENEVDCSMVRLNIPLTISDKYTSNSSRLGPKSAMFISPPKVSEKPYTLSISGDIFMSEKLVSLDSKTHKIKLSNMTNNTVHFDIDDLESLDRDVIISIERARSVTTCVTQELDKTLANSYLRFCTMVNIVPDFAKMKPVNINDCHYCILIDRSGSMHNDMQICKIAAKHFIALIPLNATFDVGVFDDRFDKYQSKTEESNLEKKTNVAEWLDSIDSRGGTEILPALRKVYADIDKSKNTVLIVISDGCVNNTKEVLQFIKSNAHVSVFSIGIGSGVDTDLILGMAKNGNGKAEFIDSGDKDIIEKVRTQLKRAQDTLRKHQNDYKIDIVSMGGLSKMIPETFAPLYEGVDNPFFIFSEFQPVAVRYSFKEYNEETNSNKDVEQIVHPIVVDSSALHRIAGIKFVDELNLAQKQVTRTSKISMMNDYTESLPAKEQIISISKDLNIVSDFTAFIGVDYKVDKVTGECVLREVPLQIANRDVSNTSYNSPDPNVNWYLANYSSANAYGCIEEADCIDDSECLDGFDDLALAFTPQRSILKQYGGRIVEQSGSVNIVDSLERSAPLNKSSSKSVSFGSSNSLSKSLSATTSGWVSSINSMISATFNSGNETNSQTNSLKSDSNKGQVILPDATTISVCFALYCILLGDNLFSGIKNISLNRLIEENTNYTSVKLKAGDILEVSEINEVSDSPYCKKGRYVIIDVGSDDSPWLIQKLN